MALVDMTRPDSSSSSSRNARENDADEKDGVSFVGLQSLQSPGFHDESTSNVQGQGLLLHLNTKLAKKSVSRENAIDGDGNLRQVLPVTFQLGQTVEVLKGFVESEIGIPMSCQELYLGSTLMMDPMSLLDYPGIDGTGDVFIAVEGEIIGEAKK